MVWRTAEKKIVGSVSIGEEGVTPPPFTPSGFLERHKEIAKYLRKEGKKYKCPSLSAIAEATNIDEETVRLHRDVMLEDEAVAEVNKDGEIICEIDSMSRLITNLRKLRV
ncbi:hypothetical protein KAU51_04390 [Candidatus Parcubacteria bacterium]|nr:hypothetical protein [Candidatus Parcubacteria bacterium]